VTERIMTWRIGVALMVLAMLPYLNALNADFTLDDELQIQVNPAVTMGVDPLRILAMPLFPGDLYRPVTTFTFAVNQALASGNAAAFRLVNLLLHGLVTVLVFVLAQRLFRSRPASLIAAALFAVHPLHTEAVTSLVGRAEELAALFGLLALLSAVRLDEALDPWVRRGWHALSVLCFTLAIMSKESGIMMLPLLWLLRGVRRNESLWRGLWTELRSLDWIPYVLCAALFMWLRFYVTGGLSSMSTVTPLENVLAFVPPLLRVRTALAVLWDYLSLLHVPLVLSADYSHAQVAVVTSWWELRPLGGAALLLSSLAAVLFLRRRAVAFAVAVPLVTLSLTSNLLFAIGTIKAERLLYTPSIGWALLVGLAMDWCWRSPRYHRLAAISVVALLCGLSTRTWARNRDWHDNATLHRSAAKSSPNCAKARYNYGVALQQQGDHAAAAREFRKALELYPWEKGAAFGIGLAYEKRGNPDAAVRWYRAALDLESSFAKAHTNLCRTLYVNARYAEAARACRDGLRYDPTDANLLKGLGGSMVGAGERQKGMVVLRRALALEPGDAELRDSLAQLEKMDAEANTAVTEAEP
jgi:Flp pilus assembly protein TadD